MTRAVPVSWGWLGSFPYERMPQGLKAVHSEWLMYGLKPVPFKNCDQSVKTVPSGAKSPHQPQPGVARLKPCPSSGLFPQSVKPRLHTAHHWGAAGAMEAPAVAPD
jgi:hypothetical protein